MDTSEGYTDRWTFVLVGGEVVRIYDPELADPSGNSHEVLTDTPEVSVAGD